jgi:eukaryotic-like serine/threonine-protein kinase
LSATERAAALSMPTAKNDAYDLYLRARYFWNEGTPTSLKEADELFERAASIDPQFVLAQAGCAATHAMGGDYDKPPEECMPKARSAALSVLKRNGRIADAHLTLARVSWSYDLDFATAERVYRRAIELEPQNALAHSQFAEMLAVLGRKDDAQNEIDLATKSAPALGPVARTAALIKYYDRRYDEAIEILKRASSLDSKYYPAHDLLARVYEVKGLKLEAIEEYLKARFMVEGGSSHVGLIKDGYGQGGWNGFWRRELEYLNGNARTSYVPPSTIAEAYLRLDDSSKALQQLNRAIDIRDGSALVIRVDPFYDNLRSESGFDALSKRIELPPPSR